MPTVRQEIADQLAHTPDWCDSEDPCRSLWAAVIERAWIDAFPPEPIRYHDHRAIKIVTDARKWLVEGGTWQHGRVFACTAAGIDEGALTRRALEHMRDIGETAETPLRRWREIVRVARKNHVDLAYAARRLKEVYPGHLQTIV